MTTARKALFELRDAWDLIAPHHPLPRAIGRATLGKDGRIKGSLRIKKGDSSTFAAVGAEEPDDPIPPPPSYRDKWRPR